MKISDSLPTFLRAQRQTPLVKWWLHYGIGLETQIKASPDGGTPVEGKRNVWRDEHGNEWWTPPRIPKHADSEPEFHDYNMPWPLELHCEAIGTTGWHWRSRRSLGFGFDFDALTHADGLTPEQLEAVTQAIHKLDYAWLTKSSGGQGLHVWVFLDGTGVETANHNEHAALARWLIGEMSRESGYDLNAQVDICGANIWIWHRKATPENGGYDLIKEGKPFPCSRIPENWKAHIPVIKRQQTKVKLNVDSPEEEDLFDMLARAFPDATLDEQHKAHIDMVREMGFASDWINDHHCWNTHTLGLKKLHEKLGLDGVYETTSAGNHPLEANCACFPRPGGAWKVYRFPFGGSPSEAPPWVVDGSNNTVCNFNVPATVKDVALAAGAEVDENKYVFSSYAEARRACKFLGIDLPEGEHLDPRQAVMTEASNNRVKITLRKSPFFNPGSDWKEKSDCWEIIKGYDQSPINVDPFDFESHIRCVFQDKKKFWFLWQPEHEMWQQTPPSEIKWYLQSLGKSKTEAEDIMGRAVRPYGWVFVNQIFQPEYPGGRRWNRDALQWAYQPLPRDAEISHPTWDALLNRLGKCLDKDLPKLDWAVENGIRTGGDYLRVCYASMLRFPYHKLPFLVFYGPENGGKSTYHEAFSLLLKDGRGAVDVVVSLTNPNEFNAELENALLAYVEEKDLSTSKGVMEKIKKYTTSKMYSHHKKGHDPTQQRSINHFAHFVNRVCYTVVPPGDTRTTVLRVESLPKNEIIEREEFHERLQAEAPAFMRTLVDLTLPDVKDRLGIPAVDNEWKQRIQDMNTDALQKFLWEQTHHIPGATIPFSEFYNRFREWLSPEDLPHWSERNILRSLPDEHSLGLYEGQKCLGNISWSPNTRPKAPLKFWKGHLIPDEDG